MDIGKRVIKVRRPSHYFDPDNTPWPDGIASPAWSRIPLDDCVDADGEPLTTDQRGEPPSGPACGSKVWRARLRKVSPGPRSPARRLGARGHQEFLESALDEDFRWGPARTEVLGCLPVPADNSNDSVVSVGVAAGRIVRREDLMVPQENAFTEGRVSAVDERKVVEGEAIHLNRSRSTSRRKPRSVRRGKECEWRTQPLGYSLGAGAAILRASGISLEDSRRASPLLFRLS